MERRNRFLKWYENQKLGRKILYTFVLVSVIPLLVTQILMLYVVVNNMKGKVDTLMMNQLVQISERMNLTLEIYTNVVYQIYADNQIIDGIISYETEDPEVQACVSREISDKLQQYSISANGIECMSIILPDGRDITYDFGIASAVDNLWRDCEDMTAIEPYVQAQDAPNMVICPTQRIFRGKEEERIFHISKKMYDFNNIQRGPIAVLVVSINESVLNAVCATGQTETDSEIYAVNFVMDGDGNVMTYPNSFYSGIKLKKGKTVKAFVEGTKELEKRRVEVNCYENEQLGWKFYNAYDRDYMLRDVSKIQVLTIVVGLALLWISVMLIHYTVGLIEKSTKNIVEGIQQVQNGNLDVHVCVDTEDEMGQIADNFNTMTGKVKNLITEVEEITQKKKDAEIKALEAQINPHFLYNTLDSINWMAIEKREYEISKMLRNLGVILRYSINKSNELVTIAELADWLDKYVSLQKMRFNDAFICEAHVSEETKKIRIHKLLVQPFVENAIQHGFKGIGGGGILRVDILLSDDKQELDIIIEDNGKGMPPGMAEKLNNRETALEDDGRSIGLNNAFTRIHMYYGEKAAWDVMSIPEMGTIITLKLPILDEK